MCSFIQDLVPGTVPKLGLQRLRDTPSSQSDGGRGQRVNWKCPDQGTCQGFAHIHVHQNPLGILSQMHNWLTHLLHVGFTLLLDQASETPQALL